MAAGNDKSASVFHTMRQPIANERFGHFSTDYQFRQHRYRSFPSDS
jgi:hypothetical protein